MQDVEKTEIQSQTSPKRRRRRNRMRPLYGLLVAALVIGVGVSLSMTVFFNIATIEIAGDAPQYTAEDIADASGVHTGDNMMRLNRDEVEQNILARMVFVDSVSIQKNFPDKLVITVTPSTPAFNVTDSSGTLQVSASGKIPLTTATHNIAGSITIMQNDTINLLLTFITIPAPKRLIADNQHY